MTQPAFDWSRDVALPVAGRTPAARHASATGAQAAEPHRGRLTTAYLRLLEEVGPRSDPEAARLLGVGVSSICSIRNGCGALVEPSGVFETKVWPNGSVSQRVRWQRQRVGPRGRSTR